MRGEQKGRVRGSGRWLGCSARKRTGTNVLEQRMVLFAEMVTFLLELMPDLAAIPDHVVHVEHLLQRNPEDEMKNILTLLNSTDRERIVSVAFRMSLIKSVIPEEERVHRRRREESLLTDRHRWCSE